MGETAKVGFHAVYTSNGGQPAISSAGNALVGAYFNQLGLSTSAVLYITSPLPQGIQWLSFSDAQRIGLDVQQIKRTSVANYKPAQTEQRPARRDGENLRLAAIKSNTYRFVTATNRKTASAMIFLNDVHANDAQLFWKGRRQRRLFWPINGRFLQRWPERHIPSDLIVVGLV